MVTLQSLCSIQKLVIMKINDSQLFFNCLIFKGLWVSYKSYETKKKGVGKVEEKQAMLHEEGRHKNKI